MECEEPISGKLFGGGIFCTKFVVQTCTLLMHSLAILYKSRLLLFRFEEFRMIHLAYKSYAAYDSPVRNRKL